VVEHFAKKQKKAKSMANQEDIKSNKKMTEGKNEVLSDISVASRVGLGTNTLSLSAFSIILDSTERAINLFKDSRRNLPF
jgi:hypothetical protein